MANRCCQIQLLFYLVCYLANRLLSVFACCRSSFRGIPLKNNCCSLMTSQPSAHVWLCTIWRKRSHMQCKPLLDNTAWLTTWLLSQWMTLQLLLDDQSKHLCATSTCNYASRSIQVRARDSVRSMNFSPRLQGALVQFETWSHLLKIHERLNSLLERCTKLFTLKLQVLQNNQ